MAYTFEIDLEHGRIAVKVAPPISDYDAAQCFREVRMQPEFRAAYGILIDLLAADRPLSLAEAERVGASPGFFFPGHRIAIVRPMLEPTASFDTFLAATSAKTDVRVFQAVRAAKNWQARCGGRRRLRRLQLAWRLRDSKAASPRPAAVALAAAAAGRELRNVPVLYQHRRGIGPSARRHRCIGRTDCRVRGRLARDPKRFRRQGVGLRLRTRFRVGHRSNRIHALISPC